MRRRAVEWGFAAAAVVAGVGVGVGWTYRRILADFDRIADGPDEVWDDAHRHLDRWGDA